MYFAKYHGLGNDYIVMDEADVGRRLTPREVERICHRNFGIGSDGILFYTGQAGDDHGLIIYNSDGSEAEKSGNGLRIFARYLWDIKLVTDVPFYAVPGGGRVRCQVAADGKEVTVEIGRASFNSKDIPVAGEPREVLREKITAAGTELEYSAVTIGNPHCIIHCEQVREDDARKYGPHLEHDPRFPNRTNVPFLQVLDRHNIKLELWERGSGYTLASGSLSSASAAVAKRLGLCDSPVTAHMPGGRLYLEISDSYDITLRGAVAKVGEGEIAEEMFL